MQYSYIPGNIIRIKVESKSDDPDKRDNPSYFLDGSIGFHLHTKLFGCDPNC